MYTYISEFIGRLTKDLKGMAADYSSEEEISSRATYLFIGCGKDAKTNAKNALDYLEMQKKEKGLFSGLLRVIGHKKYGREDYVKLFSEFTVFQVFASISALLEAGFPSELLVEMAKLLKAHCYRFLHGFATEEVLNEYSSNLLKGNSGLKVVLKDRLRKHTNLPVDDLKDHLIDNAILGSTTITMDAISMDISDVMKSIRYTG